MPPLATIPNVADRPALPRIIQIGMGVAISGWPLANAVARRSELGVVSGMVLEVVMTRRLQLGDPRGHTRRALARFPLIIDDYYLPVGNGDTKPFRFAAEPQGAYSAIKVGRIANTAGRLCVCNGLLATAGLPKYRTKNAYEEPALVTDGAAFAVSANSSATNPIEFYTAADVINYMTGSSQPAG